MEPLFVHVYNRGIDRRPVFQSHGDFLHMLTLFERYLGPSKMKSRYGELYPNYHQEVKLLSYCLIPNHFHFELEFYDLAMVSKFMQSLKTAYAKYFNAKYECSGYVFESTYNRKIVESESYYLHLSRYIHLNALAMTDKYASYQYSSLQFYLNGGAPLWLSTDRITETFGSTHSYEQFHNDYILYLASTSLSSNYQEV